MNMQLKKFDDELQVVYGEVYAPNIPDSQGDYMTPEEVRKMAHRFMENNRLSAVDTQHDNKENGSCVVESFIAREDDPLYIPDAWVVGIHVPDIAVWAKIKSGEINGFSMEALVVATQQTIEVEIPDIIMGTTIKDDTNHEHVYTVRFNEKGVFLGGFTDNIDGHSHPIESTTITGEANGHRHRYSMMEEITIAES